MQIIIKVGDRIEAGSGKLAAAPETPATKNTYTAELRHESMWVNEGDPVSVEILVKPTNGPSVSLGSVKPTMTKEMIEAHGHEWNNMSPALKHLKAEIRTTK